MVGEKAGKLLEKNKRAGVGTGMWEGEGWNCKQGIWVDLVEKVTSRQKALLGKTREAEKPKTSKT